jgi:hypothetical protein
MIVISIARVASDNDGLDVGAAGAVRVVGRNEAFAAGRVPLRPRQIGVVAGDRQCQC